MKRRESRIEKACGIAVEEYAEIGVDANRAMDQLEDVAVSLHCWQTDDVAGCEVPDAKLSGGGIQATGNFPGKARNIGEIRKDLEKVFSLVPGKHRLNLHAFYGDFGGRFVDRDQIEPEHFQSWVEWAGGLGIGMDFNCTLFSHPKADTGFTLSSKDKGIRDFWIEHVGRFHPTEQVSDKVSAVFQFIDELLFHVTRSIRWDSDHVVTLSDEVRALMQEIVWADKLSKVHIGLDFFDAGINRIGAYVVGSRATQKALLLALLDPISKMREYENEGWNFERLALMEEAKAKPFGAVWDYYCMKKGVPVGEAFIAEVQRYEREVLSRRD